MSVIGVPIITSAIGLLFVAYLVRDVLRRDPGNEMMVRISRAVQEGARAFLKREYTYVSILVIVIAALMALAPVSYTHLTLPTN